MLRFLTIGIHHYRFLPPLTGNPTPLGEWQQRLAQVTGLAPHQSLLFCEKRFFGSLRVIFPNRHNLEKAFHRPCWGLLFQGYALQYQGKDYLLPIDAQIQDLATTAIPLEQVLMALGGRHAQPRLLFLDVAALGLDNPVSNEGLLRAKQLGIHVIARFNPSGSFPGSLGEGLLEALKYYQQSLTLELLELYLREKIPSRYGEPACLVLAATGSPPQTPLFPPRSPLGSQFPHRRPWFNASETLPSPQKPFSSLPIAGLLSGGLLILFLVVSFWAVGWLIASRTPPKPVQPPPTQAELSAAIQRELERHYLQWQQASIFIQAIADLRNVPPDSPIYPAAQQQIYLWSQIILNIAQSRARVGNLPDAIAAAQLVPRDQGDLYQQAQEAIQQWRSSP